MKNYFGNTIYTDDFMWNEMKIYELPKYLYHYTSLETVALILKNMTLRFNRLDKVNDLNEASSYNLPHSNTLVFASSWTEHSEESIPMWRLYTRDMDGVRIKLPINMFKGRSSPNVFEKGGATLSLEEAIIINREGLDYNINTRVIQGPNKIYYSDEEKHLRSNVIMNYDDNVKISLYDLGMFKQKCWEYEQEWRFKLLGFTHESHLPNDSFTKDILNLGKYPIKNTFIDVPLEPSVFNEAEFTIGPKSTEAHFLLLEGLIEKYSPHATINRSSLQLR
ncbi:DUF2971 domain-containing protein [Bacillus pumilus]|uniref:DUF2971 domain-containing protein n=1 Tax=Bacillus pumilus TaxID=1408 RepID=UPI0024C11502|nr:DUF2971 domain-containing protein [Bacillus pumilus]MDH3176516.1 DUF2971 domain-containing protein [Bacillus pumilus]WHX46116.1 DUF2971 domain-containing protein [Bacillus pumilus]